MLALGILVTVAALQDVGSIAWHSAREKRQPVRLVIYSVLLESATWGPVIYAIQEDEVAAAVCSVIGSAIGTATGYWRYCRNSGLMEVKQ